MNTSIYPNEFLTKPVSVFSGVANTSPKQSTVAHLLRDIRSGDSGLRENTLLARTLESKQYKQFKKTLPAVTWASCFSGPRNKNSESSATGLMYVDVDHIHNDIDSTKKLISEIDCVAACWKSLSGKGLGILVRTADRKKNNFFSFAKILQEKNILVDQAVKDISTRLNTLSWDSEVFINEKASVLVASEEDKKIETFSSPEQDIQIDSPLVRKMYDETVAATGPIGEGNYSNFITSWNGRAISRGLSLATSFKLLSSLVPAVHSRFDIFVDNYTRYAKNVGEEPVFKVKTSNFCYKLEPSQYISDLGIDISSLDKKILNSPPGTGKTSYVVSQKEKIIVVQPTLAILKEFQYLNNGNISIYCGESKDIREEVTKYFVTYHSLEALLNELINSGEDISAWGVVFDEAHTIVEKAGIEFMNAPMVDALNIARQLKFKFITMMTGTPISFKGIPFFESFEVVTISANKRLEMKRFDVKTTSPFNSALDLIREKTADGYYVIACYNNTNTEKLEASLDSIGISSVVANSKTKFNEDYLKIIKTGRLSSDVLITTSVSEMGQSFYLPEDHSKKVVVIFIDPFSWSIRGRFQVASRCRNAKVIEIFELQKQFDGDEGEKFVPYFNTITEKVRSDCVQYNIAMKATATNKNTARKIVDALNSTVQSGARYYAFFRKDGGDWNIEPNYLAIKAWDESRRDSILKKNRELLKKQWAEFGVETMKEVEVKELQVNSELRKEIVEGKKKKIKKEINDYISSVAQIDVFENTLRLKNPTERKQMTKIEIEVTSKFEEIFSISGENVDADEILESIAAFGHDKRLWEKYKKLKQVKQSFTDDDSVEGFISREIYKQSTIGEKLTSKQIMDRVVNIINSHPILSAGELRTLSQIKAKKLFNRVFETKTSTRWNAEEKVHERVNEIIYSHV